jgi:hypothetical protein
LKNLILITSILILFLGCSPTQKFAFKKPNPQIYDLVYNGIGIDVGSTRQETIKLLGEPTKVEKTPINNKYYDFKDELTTYYYPGLEVLYYKHNHPEYGWDKVSRIDVTDNHYDLKYGIKIGMPASEVISKFGESPYPPYKNEESGAESLFYLPGDATHEQVIFVLKNGQVERFIWSNMPD